MCFGHPGGNRERAIGYVHMEQRSRLGRELERSWFAERFTLTCMDETALGVNFDREEVQRQSQEYLKFESWPMWKNSQMRHKASEVGGKGK